MAIDYQRLAAKLRGVHARRSSRAEAQNPAEIKVGGTPLHDVLHILDAAVGTGNEIDQAIEELAQQTRDVLAKGGGGPFIDDSFIPEEPLLKELTQFFGYLYMSKVPTDVMPQALTEALARGATDGGIVKSDVVREKLGGSAFDLLLQVKAGTAPVDYERGRGVREYLGSNTLEKLGRSAERRTYVDRMPALANIGNEFGGPKVLAGFRLTSIQHLFPSTLGLYDVLDKSGLDRSVLGVGGKDYSSNPTTVTRMQADGYEVHWRAEPRAFAVAQSAEAEAAEMAKDQLSRLFFDVTPEELADVAPKRRFILLDDGGKLIRALHKHFPQYAKLAVAIEQTDRGIQLIEDMQKEGKALGLPVVNMARSEAKKTSEGSIIGESVAFHTDIELERLAPGFAIDPKVATILGFGAVGQATAQALKRRGYDVVVYDPDPAAMQAAKTAGFEPLERNAALAKGHLVIGATGRGVLSPNEFDLLPSGAVLVNAASGNHEFGLDTFDEKAFANADPKATSEGHQLVSEVNGTRVTLGTTSEGSSNLHRVIRTPGGKDIVALRSGAVVNMTLGLPPEYAQLTLGLLLAGTLTAATSTDPGLIDIPQEMQDRLVKDTEKHLSSMGRDLDAPSFTGLDAWPA